MYNFFNKNRKSILPILLILLISLFSHALNMFNFPYYENDEGTYMSQAWAIINQGKLTPYTFWYDHAPFGWIMIAGWTILTGGFYTFGTAINSGRMFMLIIHLASTFLLYFISKKITSSNFPAIIATILFSLSPLAIYYQRRVLLDNLMIFLVLSSLAILYKHRLELKHIFISATVFGLAILTKESAIFFFPAFIYTVATKSHKNHRLFALTNYIFITSCVISLYPLYALLKQEFFPPGIITKSEHVSLLLTLKNQFYRGTDLPFWLEGSDLRENIRHWIVKDVFFVAIAGITTIISVISSVKLKSLRIPTIFSVSYILFLLNSKLILDFYITPVMPLIALNFSLIVHYLLESVEKISHEIKNLLRSALIISLIFLFLDNNIGQFDINETKSQIGAIEWIRNNIDPNEYILIDSYAYLDIRRDGGFSNADWYFKALFDLDVQKKLGGDTLPKVSYIFMSHNMLNDISLLQPNPIEPLFRDSLPIKYWKPAGNTYVDFDNYLSTYGDWASLNKVLNKNEKILLKSWNFYKVNFIEPDGRSYDPAIGYATTSEAQSYAMLRAVWMDDQKTFDKVWYWTASNLQKPSGLFSWYWQARDDVVQADIYPESAADADSDIALALLFASKRWGGSYEAEAKFIIDAIWENETKVINEKRYLIAGDWAIAKLNAIINPSYLSPYAYRIFAELDKKHDWFKIVDSSYEAWDKCSNSPLDKKLSVGLIPDWCEINQSNEAIFPNVANNNPTDYAYDAFRTYFRIALDYLWFGEIRALNILNTSEFLKSQWRNNKSIYEIYSHDGLKNSGRESTLAYAVNLSLFTLTDKLSADQIYNNKITPVLKNDPAGIYWEDPKNYYLQNWAWFATALHTGILPNLRNKN